MSLDLTLKNLEFKFKVSNPPENRVFEFEEFRLDASSKLLYRDDEQVPLTPKAVDTLIALVERHGDVVSKEDLMHKIWSDTIVEESNLSQYLHILRKALGETQDGTLYIETLKRRGYRFNGHVRVVKSGKEHLTDDPGEQFARPHSRNSSPFRIERRGNVKVQRNIEVDREPGHRINVERSENVYSVSDWRREPVAVTVPPVVSSAASRSSFTLVLALIAVAMGGVAFGIYSFSTQGSVGEGRQVPFSGSNLSRLTTSGNSKQSEISPDGKYFAHIVAGTDGDSLFVRQVAVANDTRLAGPLQSDLVWVTFSPDGNYVYYLALEKDKGEPELFRVPVLGGPIVKVAHDVGAPSFSPDGSKLAYMVMNQEESRLIVASLDGTNDAALMTRNPPDHLKPNETVIVSRREPDHLNMFWNAPAWSRDGRSIAFPVNQSDEKGRYETILAVDVETRVERRITDARWQQAGQPRWLEDGLVVSAAETSTGPNQLWHISLADGSAARITRDLNSYQNPSLTADASNLAVVQRNVVSNIWTLNGDAANAKQLRSEVGWLNELIWLPDGRLAYTSNAGGSSDIWTINADGSGVRQLTVGANARLGLAVTTDGKQFIFAAQREGRYNLWRVNIDGTDLERITNGEGEFYPQCTPDGRWIVYQSGGNYPTLRKMPVGGGDSTAITKTTASRPSVSPDGRFVAYHYLDSSFEISRWGIGISSIESGSLVKRFDFPSSVTERLVKWTRDGMGIAFLNSPGGIPNIWLQPLDGSDPKPLTDLPSDSIISFNWNADGSQLAVIRGVETNDILLIGRSH